MRRSAVNIRLVSRRAWILGLSIVFTVAVVWIGTILFDRSFISGKNWRVNLVFHTSPPVLLSYPSDTEEKVLLFILPESLVIDVPHGYGEYRIEAVWKLAQLEKKPDLVKDAYADLFGVPIAGVLGYERDTPADLTEQSWTSGLAGVVSLWEQKGNLLTFASRAQLWSSLLFLKPRDLIVYDLQNRSLYEDHKQPDGTSSLKVQPNSWDNYLAQKFESVQVRQDALSVEIHNTTSVLGVGQKFARFVSGVGGKVLKVGNESTEDTGCVVRVQDDYRTKVLPQFLAQEFGCIVIPRSEIDQADVVIVVGSDYGARWLKID